MEEWQTNFKVQAFFTRGIGVVFFFSKILDIKSAGIECFRLNTEVKNKRYNLFEFCTWSTNSEMRPRANHCL